jgi:ABC-type glycerol-3-phosphate transport system permease component
MPKSRIAFTSEMFRKLSEFPLRRQAIPIQAIIVPLYLLIYKLHLYDTLFALMLTVRSLGSVIMR